MSNERKFRLQVTEDELKALISHHANSITSGLFGAITTDISARIHDLTKRLHSDAPEISNDKEPIIQPEAMITSGASKSGW